MGDNEMSAQVGVVDLDPEPPIREPAGRPRGEGGVRRRASPIADHKIGTHRPGIEIHVVAPRLHRVTVDVPHRAERTPQVVQPQLKGLPVGIIIASEPVAHFPDAQPPGVHGHTRQSQPPDQSHATAGVVGRDQQGRLPARQRFAASMSA